MQPTAAWIQALLHGIREFAQTRNTAAPVVKVTLADGETFFLQSARAGPGDQLVTLAPYPPDRDEDMLPGPGGVPVTPRAIVVRPELVTKVEFLAEAPEEQEFGFQAPDEDELSDLTSA